MYSTSSHRSRNIRVQREVRKEERQEIASGVLPNDRTNEEKSCDIDFATTRSRIGYSKWQIHSDEIICLLVKMGRINTDSTLTD